ncbi:hypothetical protein HMPREF9151_02414 [Hoylesella saccharolytica F0055]|uniref:Uncharacterized protein n=1 Tax=Hoylesella saccharolytica F0055 TaxID=1127699 RepID=L1MZ48_9BACT|nr:hypothetical protein HMPREF9151_02414 [Hoylesella saccharolytica F0055]
MIHLFINDKIFLCYEIIGVSTKTILSRQFETQCFSSLSFSKKWGKGTV